MAYKVATRLRCDNCGSEMLVVKSGDGVLSCCEQEMVVVSAPGSDATPPTTEEAPNAD
jgi:hypothetical protein